MDNPIRRYAWGSREAIPHLLGVAPDQEPQAELWLGAHERAASRVSSGPEPASRSLLDVVRRDPAGELGPQWAAERRLPFLAKVIATAEPLSLQVHPDAQQAARGYATEEARGIGRDRTHRSFPDDVAKVEMVWALSHFRALCGFRPWDQAAAWLETLDITALGSTASALREHGPAALRPQVERLLRIADPAAAVAAVRGRAGALENDGRWGESARVAVALAERYPDDPAVLLALLLRPLVLAPGQAMFVRPGQPHCYLLGTAFEVQANSDNVLRAGLTGKHVDTELLVDALDIGGRGVAEITGRHDGVEEVLAPDTPRFALSVVRRARVATPLSPVAGPEIFFCVDGEFVLDDGAGPVGLAAGQSVYVPASVPALAVRGAGTLLRVSTGRYVSS